MTIMYFDSHRGWCGGTNHIGMTPSGSYINYGKPRSKPAPKRTGPFVDTSTHDLRQICFTGNSEAIAEWSHRNETSNF